MDARDVSKGQKDGYVQVATEEYVELTAKRDEKASVSALDGLPPENESYSKREAGSLRRRVGCVAIALVLVFGLLATYRIFEAYRMASSSVDAAFEEWATTAEASVESTLDAKDKGRNSFHRQVVAMLDRAGQGEDDTLEERKEHWERLEMASDGEEKRKKRRRFRGKPASNTDSFGEVYGASKYAKGGKGGKPQNDAEAVNWGDIWLQKEINAALGDKKDELNSEMHNLVAEKMNGQEMPSNAQTSVEYVNGLETLQIDKLEVVSVKSDLVNGNGEVIMSTSMHTDDISAGGKVRLKGKADDPWIKGKYFTFQATIHGFGGEAKRMVGDFDYDTREVTKAYVDQLNCHYTNVDGACYSKKDPTKKDKLCTWFMMKKLNGGKAEMLAKLSAQMKSGMQHKIDSMLPFRMENAAGI